MSDQEKKKFKLRHELNKNIIEKPLELEVDGKDSQLEVSPDQKEILGNSVRFVPNDQKKPLKRTVVGGVDKFKEYVKNREREAQIKEKLATAIKKQHSLILQRHKEPEMVLESKPKKKTNILKDLSKGMVRNESLRSIA